jgi:hypothetical protein
VPEDSGVFVHEAMRHDRVVNGAVYDRVVELDATDDGEGWSMGTCAVCGNTAWGDLCARCSDLRRAQEGQQVQQRLQEEATPKVEALAASEYERVAEALLTLPAVRLYDYVLLNVDSLLVTGIPHPFGPFELLQERGLSGWRVVAAIPRTRAEEWGGGTGGNVTAVYLVLELEVRPGDLQMMDEHIRSYCERRARAGASRHDRDRAPMTGGTTCGYKGPETSAT